MAKLKINATLTVGEHFKKPFSVDVDVEDEPINIKPLANVEFDIVPGNGIVTVSAKAFGFLNVHKDVKDTYEHPIHVGVGAVELEGTLQLEG
jgi:hypothetical protein